MGQRIGAVGKQGTSGGWVHLHFEIKNKDNPSGMWATEDAYAYCWESYMKQYNPPLVAVARPHQFIWSGQEATLDGGKSKSLAGNSISYEWIFSDGTTAKGAVQKKTYEKPGEYSEILKVTDLKGNTDYDFMVVQVSDRKNPEKVFPTLQAAYHPTLDIRPGTPVTFLVRTFNSRSGNKVWDFGDGSPLASVKSEVSRQENTKGKFAETVHSFSKPGHYIITVERINEYGYKALGHLHVVVNKTK